MKRTRPDMRRVRGHQWAADLLRRGLRVIVCGWNVIDKCIDRLLCGPCNTAQQHLLDLVVAEVSVFVALHPDEGARGLASGRGMLIGPDLRNDFTFVRACAGCAGNDCCSQDVNGRIMRPGQVIESFIEDCDVGHALHDGIGEISDGVWDGRAESVVDLAVLFAGSGESGEIGGIRPAE